MPPTAETQAASLAATPARSAVNGGGRCRCTEVARLIDVTAIEVTFAGDRVALRLHSLHGTTIAHAPLAAFLAGCRGTHDANGNPFPTLAKAERVKEQLADDAAALPPPAADVDRRRGPRDPEREAQYREAFRLHIVNGEPVPALAASLGVSRSALYNHFVRFRKEHGAPVLKPSGAIL